jgi:hypothetical protein
VELALELASALVQEVASANKASDVGIPWEQHLKAKAAFEKEGLKDILASVFQLLEVCDVNGLD